MEILEVFGQLLELKRHLLERFDQFLVCFLQLYYSRVVFYVFAELAAKNYIFCYKKFSRS